jgi:hypothetical protein
LLLVLAAAGLAAVVLIGALLIFTRGGDTKPAAREPTAREEAPAAPASEQPTTATTPRPGRSTSPTPTLTPTPERKVESTVEAQIAATGEIPPGTAPEHLPIWARPPRVTSQPFPEGGRINPPLPPVKIPPEMLVPLPGADPAPATIP